MPTVNFRSREVSRVTVGSVVSSPLYLDVICIYQMGIWIMEASASIHCFPQAAVERLESEEFYSIRPV